MKDDVVVGDMFFALMVIAAELPVFFAKNMKRSGHTEMHQQHVAGGQICEQIFGAPADTRDGPAVEPLRKILRQWPAQIAAANLDLGKALAFHGRFEAAAYCFDFGQFGHCFFPVFNWGMIFREDWYPLFGIMPHRGNVVNFKHIASLGAPRYAYALKDQR